MLQFILIGLSFVFSMVPPGFDYSSFTDPLFDSASAKPSPFFKLQWGTLTALSLWIIWRRRRVALQVLPNLNPYLFVFFFWCAASSLWAVEPAKTFTQTVSMMFVAIIAFGTTLTAWQPDSLSRVLRPVLTGVMVMSAIVAFVNPSIGVEAGDQFELQGSWRGMTMTKNVLGQVGAIAIIVWVHAWATRQTKPLVTLFGLAISVFVMLKSRSSTSLFLSLLCSGVLAAMLRSPIRLEGKRAIVGLSIALTILTPIFFYLVFVGSFAYDDIASPIGHAVGKDATFSGRTPIWAEVWAGIQNHWWMGVGFMGFWNGRGSLAEDILRDLQWPIPHSHNGYLDMWNELGLIGIFLFAGFLIVHIWQIFRLDARNRSAFVLHFVIVPYLVIANITETGWFRPISVTLVVSVFSSMNIARLLFEQRLQALRSKPSTIGIGTSVVPPAAAVPWGPL